MTEEQTLTRAESAKLYSDIVGHIVTHAPDSTGGIKMFGPDDLFASYDAADMHEDHLAILVEQLSSQKVLDKIDELAAAARAVMTAVAVPWYDEPTQ